MMTQQACGSRHLQEGPFRSISTILPSFSPSSNHPSQHYWVSTTQPTHPPIGGSPCTLSTSTTALIAHLLTQPCGPARPKSSLVLAGLTSLIHRRDAFGTLCCSKAPPGLLCQWIPWVGDVGAMELQVLVFSCEYHQLKTSRACLLRLCRRHWQVVCVPWW